MTAQLVQSLASSTALSSTLPNASRSEVNGVRVSTTIKPVGDGSGDFVFVAPRGAQVCVVIGDACGTGAPAARLVAHVLPHIAELAPFVESPSELLSLVNDAVAGQLGDDGFVTATALIIDSATGLVQVSNAGHVPPILRRSEQTQLVGVASGPPLGMIGGAQYSDDSLALEQGDILVLMTDGVVEAVEDDLVVMPKLRTLLSRAPQDLDAISRLIFSEVARAATRSDDRAVVGLELTAGPSTAAACANAPSQQAA